VPLNASGNDDGEVLTESRKVTGIEG